jgi:hypothetical protein
MLLRNEFKIFAGTHSDIIHTCTCAYHRSPCMVPNLRKLIPVQTIKHSFLTIYFNIIFMHQYFIFKQALIH